MKNRIIEKQEFDKIIQRLIEVKIIYSHCFSASNGKRKIFQFSGQIHYNEFCLHHDEFYINSTEIDYSKIIFKFFKGTKFISFDELINDADNLLKEKLIFNLDILKKII